MSATRHGLVSVHRDNKRNLNLNCCANDVILAALDLFLGPDDCDFNLQLKNSAYAKVRSIQIPLSAMSLIYLFQNLDAARFKCLLTVLPTFFRIGGWIALGGEDNIHQNFLGYIDLRVL